VGVSAERDGLGRRVGVFRALLLAHGQMMVNRTRRGLGRRGLAGAAVVLAIMLAGAAPLFAAFGVLGYLFGAAIDDPRVAPMMGTVLLGTSLGFGVLGGLLGGARQLTWEAYRSFPVPFRTLFLAETTASMGDLVLLGFVGAVAAMGGAFVWERPESAPLVLLLMGELVAWVLFTQHLVGSLAVTAVRRLRHAVVVLAIASWAGVSVVAGAARDIHADLLGTEISRLREVWHHVRPVVSVLPPVLSVRAVAASHRGAFMEAVTLELPMLAATFVLGVLSYVVLRGETSPAATRSTTVASSERRFAGKLTPTWALARLQLHHMTGSLQGRFGLIVPLITVVLVRGPLATAGVGPAFSLPGSVVYVALASTQFQYNQFGLDGQGVKTLFLLPVSMRQVLVGKTYALLAYVTAQNALLLVLLIPLVRPSAGDAASVTLLAAALSLSLALEGHWISVMYPRPLARDRMNATGLSNANLLPLGLGMVNAAAFGGLYALVSWLAPGARIPLLAAVVVAFAAAYRALLPRAARFVEDHRERLVEVLG